MKKESEKYQKKSTIKIKGYSFLIEDRFGVGRKNIEKAKSKLIASLQNVPKIHLEMLGSNVSFIFYSFGYFCRSGNRTAGAFCRGEFDHSYVCIRKDHIGDAQIMTHEIGHAVDYNLSAEDEKFWIRKWKEQQSGKITSISKTGYHMRHPGEFFATHYEFYYEYCVGKRYFDKEILDWFKNFDERLKKNLIRGGIK